jgi:quercetin dioxygenase-like cupin family protein
MAKAIFDGLSSLVLNLLGEVPVVPGSVVSKPLVQADGCKVIVFAMDKDQSISDHQAPFVAMVQVLDGVLDFSVGEQTYRLAANDLLVMPSNARHSLTALEPTRFLLTMAR